MTISNAWAIYAGILTGALSLYYLFVGWKFYRLEISSLFAAAKTKRRLSISTAAADSQPPGPNVLDEKAAIEPSKPFVHPPLPEHQDLYDQLTLEIEEASQQKYNKQDLIQMLQMILKEYPSLTAPPLQDAVSRHIDTECARFGAVLLNPADKAELWEMQ